MKNYFDTAVFSSALSLILIIIIGFLGVEQYNTRVENELLKQQVDSLRSECNTINSLYSEATHMAIQLSDRINRLYEIDSAAHKKLFSETD